MMAQTGYCMSPWDKNVEYKCLHCRNCHHFITWYTQDQSGSQLYRNGKPVGAKSFGNTYIIEGRKLTGLPVQCPQCGKVTHIKDTPAQIAEAKRLQFNFEKWCIYHDKDNITCDQRLPCADCIVYQNRLITEDTKCLPIM